MKKSICLSWWNLTVSVSVSMTFFVAVFGSGAFFLVGDVLQEQGVLSLFGLLHSVCTQFSDVSLVGWCGVRCGAVRCVFCFVDACQYLGSSGLPQQ